jgi:hypothetical protein
VSQGKGRIGIIIFQYYLGVSVSVLETARFLERNGYTVVIYIDEPSFVASPAVFDESNIEVVRVRKALPEGCSGNNRPGAIGRFLKKAVLAAAAWQHQH